MEKEISWKIEQTKEGEWVAESSTGIKIYADCEVKIWVWLQGEEYGKRGEKATGENAAKNCGRRSRKNTKKGCKPRRQSQRQGKAY